MPKWFEKILKYSPGEKSLRAPFAIYLDLDCLLKKEQSHQNNPEQPRQNNPEKSYTEKKSKHERSGWAVRTKCSFDKKENKLNYYRGKEHAMKIINYKEKKWCN